MLLSKSSLNALSKATLVLLVFVGIIIISKPLSVYSREVANSEDLSHSTGTQPSVQELIPETIYLPLSLKLYPALTLQSAWSADDLDIVKAAYLPGTAIRLYGGGINLSTDNLTANFKWNLDGPCGAALLHDGDVELGSGEWRAYLPATVPECTGVYTHTIQVTHNDLNYINSSRFVVNNPSAAVLSDEPAFDKCWIPTLDQLKTWMEESPYSGVNVYIGGIHRACANYGLDAFWVHEVTKLGWKLIPTWVGPQAPCSKFKYRISADAELAYLEGKMEADAAYRAADNLGLMGGNNVIYYDLEGYSTTDTSCREASAAFLRGWTERLHEYGLRAGAYGGSCSSYIKDWAKNIPILDNVWIADWTSTYPDYRYVEDATVWDARCLDDPEILYWTNHQRIKQYAGDHTETWGGVSMKIDSNIADGELVVIPQGPFDQQSLGQQGSIEEDPGVKQRIYDLQLLSPDSGWALANQRLLWTEDGGVHWQDITPMAGSAQHLLGVDFTGDLYGWAVSRSIVSDDLSVHRTLDGGLNWNSSFLPDVPGDVGAAYLNFIDSSTGWLVLKLQSSSNFSSGLLFRTKDGGESWEQYSLPIGEPVQFIDSDRGWIAGGVSGAELYQTTDGGKTWQPQNVISMDEFIPGRTLIGLPKFDGSQYGLLPVTITEPGNSRVDLFTSRDGGSSWKLTSSLFFLDDAPTNGVVLELAGTDKVFVAQPGAGIGDLDMSTKHIGSGNISVISNLPEGVIDINFADSRYGWAHAKTGACTGDKALAKETGSELAEPFTCQIHSILLQTADGGQTWKEITPAANSVEALGDFKAP